ncbi:MAG: pilus assembly protein TadG-related protein, partial [Anderseniella sp.]
MTVSKVAKFLTHKGGNIGITLAVAAIPLVASAGIAVDYINRNQAQARVQAAVDAGALAGASMRNASEASIRKAIKDFAETNGVGEYLNNPSALKIEIASNGAITVEAEGRVPTTLSRVLGFEYLEVGARSQALRGESGAE